MKYENITKITQQKMLLLATSVLVPSIINFAVSGVACADILPFGGEVKSGTASITVQNGTKILDIEQTTEKAIIEWDGFSVGQDYTVNFKQPNALSSTLNRVIGNQRSVIAGKITATGKVFLINPNGILFTNTADINVGGLIASTLDIQDQNFSNGLYTFFRKSPTSGIVENDANITVNPGGVVALLGGAISNSATVTAKFGKVALGAGDEITVSFGQSDLLNVTIPAKKLQTILDSTGNFVGLSISNTGNILADGGTIQVSVKTVKDILNNTINIGGLIQAKSVENTSGKIILGGGSVTVSGTVDASGDDSTKQDGGSIHINTKASTDIQTSFTLSGKLLAKGIVGGAISVKSFTSMEMKAALYDVSSVGGGGIISHSNVVHVSADTVLGNKAGGTVVSSATYMADSVTGTAGKIDITAGQVLHMLGTRISANGVMGGIIRIGGSYYNPALQSQDPPAPLYGERLTDMSALHFVSHNNMTTEVEISANGSAGNGGIIFLQASDKVYPLGNASATGTQNGGFIKTAATQVTMTADCVPVCSQNTLTQSFNVSGGIGVGKISIYTDNTMKNIIISNDVENISQFYHTQFWYMTKNSIHFVNGTTQTNGTMYPADVKNGDFMGAYNGISLNQDGTKIAVGNSQEGQVYLFSLNANNAYAPTLQNIIQAQNHTGSFGFAVSLSGDGEYVAVSDNIFNNNTAGQGKVFIYALDNAMKINGKSHYTELGGGISNANNTYRGIIDGKKFFGDANGDHFSAFGYSLDWGISESNTATEYTLMVGTLDLGVYIWSSTSQKGINDSPNAVNPLHFTAHQVMGNADIQSKQNWAKGRGLKTFYETSGGFSVAVSDWDADTNAYMMSVVMGKVEIDLLTWDSTQNNPVLHHTIKGISRVSGGWSMSDDGTKLAGHNNTKIQFLQIDWQKIQDGAPTSSIDENFDGIINKKQYISQLPALNGVVALSGDGQRMLVAGGSNAGGIKPFSRNIFSAGELVYSKSVWTDVEKIQAEVTFSEKNIQTKWVHSLYALGADTTQNNTDAIGVDISMNADGTKLALSNYILGKVYLFSLNKDKHYGATLQTTIEKPQNNHHFGYAVALSSDAKYLAVSGRQHNNGNDREGVVYVYALNTAMQINGANIYSEDGLDVSDNTKSYRGFINGKQFFDQIGGQHTFRLGKSLDWGVKTVNGETQYILAVGSNNKGIYLWSTENGNNIHDNKSALSPLDFTVNIPSSEGLLKYQWAKGRGLKSYYGVKYGHYVNITNWDVNNGLYGIITENNKNSVQMLTWKGNAKTPVLQHSITNMANISKGWSISDDGMNLAGHTERKVLFYSLDWSKISVLPKDSQSDFDKSAYGVMYHASDILLADKDGGLFLSGQGNSMMINPGGNTSTRKQDGNFIGMDKYPARSLVLSDSPWSRTSVMKTQDNSRVYIEMQYLKNTLNHTEITLVASNDILLFDGLETQHIQRQWAQYALDEIMDVTSTRKSEKLGRKNTLALNGDGTKMALFYGKNDEKNAIWTFTLDANNYYAPTLQHVLQHTLVPESNSKDGVVSLSSDGKYLAAAIENKIYIYELDNTMGLVQDTFNGQAAIKFPDVNYTVTAMDFGTQINDTNNVIAYALVVGNGNDTGVKLWQGQNPESFSLTDNFKGSFSTDTDTITINANLSKGTVNSIAVSDYSSAGYKILYSVGSTLNFAIWDGNTKVNLHHKIFTDTDITGGWSMSDDGTKLAGHTTQKAVFYDIHWQNSEMQKSVIVTEIKGYSIALSSPDSAISLSGDGMLMGISSDVLTFSKSPWAGTQDKKLKLYAGRNIIFNDNNYSIGDMDLYASYDIVNGISGTGTFLDTLVHTTMPKLNDMTGTIYGLEKNTFMGLTQQHTFREWNFHNVKSVSRFNADIMANDGDNNNQNNQVIQEDLELYIETDAQEFGDMDLYAIMDIKAFNENGLSIGNVTGAKYLSVVVNTDITDSNNIDTAQKLHIGSLDGQAQNLSASEVIVQLKNETTFANYKKGYGTLVFQTSSSDTLGNIDLSRSTTIIGIGDTLIIGDISGISEKNKISIYANTQKDRQGTPTVLIVGDLDYNASVLSAKHVIAKSTNTSFSLYQAQGEGMLTFQTSSQETLGDIMLRRATTIIGTGNHLKIGNISGVNPQNSISIIANSQPDKQGKANKLYLAALDYTAKELSGEEIIVEAGTSDMNFYQTSGTGVLKIYTKTTNVSGILLKRKTILIPAVEDSFYLDDVMGQYDFTVQSEKNIDITISNIRAGVSKLKVKTLGTLSVKDLFVDAEILSGKTVEVDTHSSNINFYQASGKGLLTIRTESESVGDIILSRETVLLSEKTLNIGNISGFESIFTVQITSGNLTIGKVGDGITLNAETKSGILTLGDMGRPANSLKADSLIINTQKINVIADFDTENSLYNVFDTEGEKSVVFNLLPPAHTPQVIDTITAKRHMDIIYDGDLQIKKLVNADNISLQAQKIILTEPNIDMEIRSLKGSLVIHNAQKNTLQDFENSYFKALPIEYFIRFETSEHNIGDIQAKHKTYIFAQGSITFGSIKSAKEITIESEENITIDSISDTNTLDIITMGNINLGNVNTGANITLQGYDITAGNINTVGDLKGTAENNATFIGDIIAQSVSINTKGNTTAGNITVTDTLDIVSMGNISLADIEAGANITLQGYDITAGNINTVGDLKATAKNDIIFTGDVTVSRAIFESRFTKGENIKSDSLTYEIEKIEFSNINVNNIIELDNRPAEYETTEDKNSLSTLAGFGIVGGMGYGLFWMYDSFYSDSPRNIPQIENDKNDSFDFFNNKKKKKSRKNKKKNKKIENDVTGKAFAKIDTSF